MGHLKRNRRMQGWDEDPKPMDGVANLSDAMLVFACGLMIAIAVNWKVDLKIQKVDVEPENLITENEINEVISDTSDDSVYQEMGKVYKDPDTGDMYMVSD